LRLNAESHDDTADHGGGARPSKSARKRTAHAAQNLGETLLALADEELAALPLPESLLEALRDARRIRSRAARARQRQYIGKLMRTVDPQAVRAALAERERTGRGGVATERLFRALEALFATMQQ
jgi:ribosome-associated protein